MKEIGPRMFADAFTSQLASAFPTRVLYRTAYL